MPRWIPLTLLVAVATTWDMGWTLAASPCDMHYPSDAAVAWECRIVREGETLEQLFGNRWVDVARFNRIDRRHVYAGVRLRIPRRVEDLASFTPLPRFLADADISAKSILIDLSEQFLGAYERGRLQFSMPITSGMAENETPSGEFRITVAHRFHESSMYTLRDTDIPYPMTYALFFFINEEGVSFWIHGRDLPGVPASHGCIGLYDELMQKRYYGEPGDPVLEDARHLYQWVVGDQPDDGSLMRIENGPKVVIFGRAPEEQSAVEPPAEVAKRGCGHVSPGSLHPKP